MREEEAVQLGEAVPPEKRDIPIRMNLGVSYFLAGRKDAARAQFDSIAEEDDLPEMVRTVLDDWMQKLDNPDEDPAQDS